MNNSLPKVDFPELFFALVAPIGTNLDNSVTELTSQLNKFDYKVVDIRVTDTFDDFANVFKPKTDLVKSPKRKRYETHIAYGNQIREEFQDNSILAIAAMYQIAEKRKTILEQTGADFSKKIAYIIRQFKRPEEIDLLRSTYNDQFFQISIYSRRDFRVEHLCNSFAKDEGIANPDDKKSEAEKLVSIDENEKGSSGQKVRKIFHQADFIIDADKGSDTKNDAEAQVSRFVKLLFGHNAISPTKYEYGMKLAKAAALRSIDISRQVGAAIFSDCGQIISLGSNEVPKAGGGTYWADDPKDAREYLLGEDSNDQRKKELLLEVLDILKIPDKEKATKMLSDAQLMDALEYGRVVHAEMSAISDAARGGLSVKDGVLYCTTFPCHMCAKHIVASGMQKVVFLEPYPKSLVGRQHMDSINVEGKNRGKYKEFDSVDFEHFYGVTPRKFDMLFYRGKRKNEHSKFIEYSNDPCIPNITVRNLAYLKLEETIIKNMLSMVFTN